MMKFATRKQEEESLFKSQKKYYQEYYEELELMAQEELEYAEMAMEKLMMEVEEI